MLKPSEINRRLKHVNVPKELRIMLETMASDQIAFYQQLSELAMMLDSMMTIVNNLTEALGIVMTPEVKKSAQEMLKRKQGMVSSEEIMDAELKND